MSAEMLYHKLISMHVLIDNNFVLWNEIFLVLLCPKFGAIKVKMYKNIKCSNNKLYLFMNETNYTRRYTKEQSVIKVKL